MAIEKRKRSAWTYTEPAPPYGFKGVKSNEWYTPARYIDAARKVMGGIDLDPASSEAANCIVKAAQYYTAEENGLIYRWYGRVWLNPPYAGSRASAGRGIGRGNSSGTITPFVQKLIGGYRRGEVEQAVLLVTTDTDAKWFLPLWDFPICFADHKVMFHRPGLPNAGQFFGTSFVYMGQDIDRFVEVFSRFGPVARAINRPRQGPITPELWQADWVVH